MRLNKGCDLMWRYCNSNELYHLGIFGMKWGVRRYQNPDGTLTEMGRKRLEKKDVKWAKSNYKKIMSKTRKSINKDLREYEKQILSQPESYTSRGEISSTAINAYNRRMAELMNREVALLSAPSGRAVKFVAKRGEVGVHLALADRDYDMEQLKNGVWTSGRIAYKKRLVNMT